MTDREKVINGLESLHTRLLDAATRDRIAMLDAIIVADALALLKAQEPNEDWISRKRLKDEIQYYIDEAGWGDGANKVLGWCMEFIDNQMAVKWE